MGDVSRESSVFKAAAAAWFLMFTRVPLNTYFLIIVSEGDTQVIKTNPMGLAGDPPVGPAMPVVARLREALKRSRTPLARATATGADTAPYFFSKRGETLRMSVLAVLA